MRKDDLKLSRHHIICKSRGGNNDPSNIAMVKQGLHRKYHELFSNKTPNEILEFLENYFWGGDKSFIDFYSESNERNSHVNRFRKLFGVKDGS